MSIKCLKGGYLRNERRTEAFNEEESSHRFLPCSVVLPCACFFGLIRRKKNLFVHGQNVFVSFNLCFICRQDKDSKDEAAKAERELEEIRKVIEESGGKLSNRVLQCEVSEQG